MCIVKFWFSHMGMSKRILHVLGLDYFLFHCANECLMFEHVIPENSNEGLGNTDALLWCL